MKAWIFACDIDNTIIYSRRRPHEGFVCVEWIQGAEQAYMSPATIAGMAAALRRSSFIPVTSRSMEQYRRLRFPEGCVPAWCVTGNGADLLHRGEADGDWRRETKRLLAADENELMRMHALLREDARFLRCRIVDGAYLYVHCGEAVRSAQLMPVLSRMTSLKLTAAGSKLYLLPRSLDKATAVERLQRRFSGGLICAGDSEMEMADAASPRKPDVAAVERLRRRTSGGLICAGDSEMEMADAALPRKPDVAAVERLRRRTSGGLICAGDSEMDLPMLEMADVALLPRSLRPLWHGRGRCEVPEDGELFSEFVFERALAVLNS